MAGTPKDRDFYWELGFRTVKDLETERGILASARNELYGCIFGRDSLITSLKLLRVYKKVGTTELLDLIKKVLLNLSDLQGKEINIESGEQPGKIIHEYRPDNHEHLTKNSDKPWYVYPDGQMRIYDAVDATPLYLITAYRYWQASGDNELIEKILPNIEMALQWLLIYGDSNGDGFVDYEFNPERHHGGLVTQNWMDSADSVFHETGEEVAYPVAPVEAQAYAYLAMRLWSNYFASHEDLRKSRAISQKASDLKRNFNKKFVIFDDNGLYLAPGLDGNDQPLGSVRSSMGHVLWAATNLADDGKVNGIIYRKFVPQIVKRLMSEEIFEPMAGIRTLSVNSKRFDPYSYHNGSIWPHDNGLIAEGFENYGYKRSARKVRRAVLNAVSHFATPIELFVFMDSQYFEYCSMSGQKACRQQAWSAAAILDMAITELQ